MTPVSRPVPLDTPLRSLSITLLLALCTGADRAASDICGIDIASTTSLSIKWGIDSAGTMCPPLGRPSRHPRDLAGKPRPCTPAGLLWPGRLTLFAFGPSLASGPISFELASSGGSHQHRHRFSRYLIETGRMLATSLNKSRECSPVAAPLMTVSQELQPEQRCPCSACRAQQRLPRADSDLQLSAAITHATTADSAARALHTTSRLLRCLSLAPCS
jgi:hypothetical protein